MTVRSTLIKLHWLISSVFGIYPLRLLQSLRGIRRFLRDWLCFRRGYSGALTLMPCLDDWYDEGGTTKSEYFGQDLLVARMIDVRQTPPWCPV